MKRSTQGKYIIGIDTGGTFTDAIVFDPRTKQIFMGKTPTTPHDFSIGVMSAVADAAKYMNISARSLLEQCSIFKFGTTVGTNALLTRRGSKVGFITTKGFEDTTLIGRAIQKTDGLSDTEIVMLPYTTKPEPLVPTSRIRGVYERIDFSGNVVIPLNVDDAVAGAERLVAKGVTSIAVCFLWSFVNDSHEKQVKAVLSERYPGLPVSISSEVSPVLGEYERTVTTVINSYLTPAILKHIHNLRDSLKARGLKSPLLIMQCSGGCVTLQDETGHAH